ncbi:MAG TPA: hypothetical protein VFU21_15205 [Kofleriaceae bacterium]|nr:hypothetical protein [Kofleriaceae bacterium]
MSALEERTPQPMFDQPVTGVSRRRATLPSAEEVAPVVVAYLRQVGGEPLSPHEIEALLPPPSPAPRSRETMLLVGLAVLLFLAAFAVAFALLPLALS